MTTAEIKDPMMLKPVMTVDGKPWVQRCYVCGKTVNFLKDAPHQRVKVMDVVRHSKCYPEALR